MTKLSDIILTKIENRKENFFSVDIKYPNGDGFKGKTAGNFSKIGRGIFTWDEGYSYEGEFFANTPYGWGMYKDCLGVERPGYFFKGFRLNQNFGLEGLKQKLKKDYSKEGTVTVTNEDLRLLMDSDIVIGSQMFRDCPIEFRKMYINIEESRKTFIDDLTNIKDGELDYKYNWENNTLTNIRALILYKEIGKLDEIIQDQTLKKSVQKFSQDFSEKIVGQKKLQVENLAIYKEHDKMKHGWIYELDLNNISGFQVEEIVEMVQDQDYRGLRHLYKRFLKEKLLKKFFKINDSKNRNLLMIAAFSGHRQIFIDILTALVRAIRKEKMGKWDVLRYLEQRDHEHNNVIDLLCVKGIEINEEDVLTNKVNFRVNWSLKEKLSKSTAHEEKNTAKTSNKIYNEIIESLKSSKSKVFSSNFMTYERIQNLVERKKQGESTSNILILSKRSICLFTLFEVMNQLPYLNPLPQSTYDEKRNNPLHFTLFHGDLHATIELLKYKTDMLLWRNKEKELPPQVIKWSGPNYSRSRAVFASILREFTRNFNLKVIRELLLDKNKILKPHKKKSIHEFEEEEEDERKRVEKIKIDVEKNHYFDPENVYLYCNNYVLLSNELCKQYIQLIRDKSRFRQIKTDHRVQKNLLLFLTRNLNLFKRTF